MKVTRHKRSYMILLYEMSRIGKSLKTEGRLVVVAMVLAEGRMGVTSDAYRLFFFGDEKF